MVVIVRFIPFVIGALAVVAFVYGPRVMAARRHGKGERR